MLLADDQTVVAKEAVADKPTVFFQPLLSARHYTDHIISRTVPTRDNQDYLLTGLSTLTDATGLLSAPRVY
jgi:hypothetical protein